MKKRRIYQAFVAVGFANTGRMYGFASQAERDAFVREYKGAKPRAFTDVTPRQFREWQEEGHWTDYISNDATEYIAGGSLLRHGIDNDWPMERR